MEITRKRSRDEWIELLARMTGSATILRCSVRWGLWGLTVRAPMALISVLVVRDEDGDWDEDQMRRTIFIAGAAHRHHREYQQQQQRRPWGPGT